MNQKTYTLIYWVGVCFNIIFAIIQYFYSSNIFQNIFSLSGFVVFLIILYVFQVKIKAITLFDNLINNIQKQESLESIEQEQNSIKQNVLLIDSKIVKSSNSYIIIWLGFCAIILITNFYSWNINSFFFPIISILTFLILYSLTSDLEDLKVNIKNLVVLNSNRIQIFWNTVQSKPKSQLSKHFEYIKSNLDKFTLEKETFLINLNQLNYSNFVELFTQFTNNVKESFRMFGMISTFQELFKKIKNIEKQDIEKTETLKKIELDNAFLAILNNKQQKMIEIEMTMDNSLKNAEENQTHQIEGLNERIKAQLSESNTNVSTQIAKLKEDFNQIIEKTHNEIVQFDELSENQMQNKIENLFTQLNSIFEAKENLAIDNLNQISKKLDNKLEEYQKLHSKMQDLYLSDYIRQAERGNLTEGDLLELLDLFYDSLFEKENKHSLFNLINRLLIESESQ